MCGFNTIFHYNESRRVDIDELRKIRDHMSVRGPDGYGEWLSDDGCVGFGHRRLSIIDLSERGAQPMHSVDGRYSITFNGEIYNYKPLREELLASGWRFHSDTDTEVLMGLYARHGSDMLPRLRGMFAFTIWDHEKRTLFAARDPYGIKPVYYADDGRAIRLASQVKALLAGGQISSEIDHASLLHFLMLGSVPEPETIYSAIKALPAGSWMSVDSAGVHGPVEYFSVSRILFEAQSRESTFTPSGDAVQGGAYRGAAPRYVPLRGTTRHDEAEVNAIVAEELRDSVAHHMIADVPVGAFLSAGIDSGTLVGLVRDAGNRRSTDGDADL